MSIKKNKNDHNGAGSISRTADGYETKASVIPPPNSKYYHCKYNNKQNISLKNQNKPLTTCGIVVPVLSAKNPKIKNTTIPA